MEDLSSGQQFILSRGDLLYKNLLGAKQQNPGLLTIESLTPNYPELPEPEPANHYQLKR